MKYIIVPGLSAGPSDKEYKRHWMSWLKNELDKRGIPTEIVSMPHPWEPVYEDAKKVFDKIDINEDTILIGHSAGCASLARYLGERKVRVKKLILVAPLNLDTMRSQKSSTRTQLIQQSEKG